MAAGYTDTEDAAVCISSEMANRKIRELPNKQKEKILKVSSIEGYIQYSAFSRCFSPKQITISAFLKDRETIGISLSVQ